MPEARLPEQFQDLEKWIGWALETEDERSDRRQASAMARHHRLL